MVFSVFSSENTETKHVWAVGKLKKMALQDCESGVDTGKVTMDF